MTDIIIWVAIISGAQLVIGLIGLSMAVTDFKSAREMKSIYGTFSSTDYPGRMKTAQRQTKACLMMIATSPISLVAITAFILYWCFKAMKHASQSVISVVKYEV